MQVLNPFRYSVSKEIQSFAIGNYNEMFGYIATGRVNIRIHRDIEGKMWFGVGGVCALCVTRYIYYMLYTVQSG